MTSILPRVLYAGVKSDEPETFQRALSTAVPMEWREALSLDDLRDAILQETVDCVIQGTASNVFQTNDVLTVVRQLRPDLPVITLVSPGAIDEAVRAIKAGANTCLDVTRLNAATLTTAIQAVLTNSIDTSAKIGPHIDPVTGLLNRAGFLNQVDGALKRPATLQVGIVVVNVMHFSAVNEALGFAAADKILCEIARRLTASPRSAHIAARLEGDKFAVLFSPCPSLATLTLLAHHLLDSLVMSIAVPATSALGSAGGQEFILKANAGISFGAVTEASAEELLCHAETALCALRHEGRNRLHMFSAETNFKIARQLNIDSALTHALDKNELSVHLQPIWHLSSKIPAGAEALLRWTHNSLGQITPAEFIPIAERTGLIAEIDIWVLEQACKFLGEHSELPHDFTISVNISACQFTNPELAFRMIRAAERYGVSPSRIKLEFRNVLQAEDASKVFSCLRSSGFQLSVDNYGEHGAYISYLELCNFNVLKLDKTFVHRLIHDEVALEAARTIIDQAHKRNLIVVAEGIETEEQRELLIGTGCDMGQGFLLNPAQPMADFMQWFASGREAESATT